MQKNARPDVRQYGGTGIRMPAICIQRHIRDSEIGIHARTEQSDRDECGALPHQNLQGSH